MLRVGAISSPRVSVVSSASERAQRCAFLHARATRTRGKGQRRRRQQRRGDAGHDDEERLGERCVEPPLDARKQSRSI